MTQLHEILAVEGDLEATFKKIIAEGSDTFTKKGPHFMESTRTVEMMDDGRSHENTVEVSPMVETVLNKLRYVAGHSRRYFNAFAAKERTNQDARADLMLDGEVLIDDVPATMLLGLEKRLGSFRDMCSKIPTLDPGIDWIEDLTAVDPGVSINKLDEERFKTEKSVQHKVVTEATDHHPAQVERWQEDRPVGKIKIRHRSSMMSPLEKSRILERCDELIREVKKARQRANKAEVVNMDIASPIFKYLLG